MDDMYVETGEETSRWEAGVKNKWRWDWIEETGADGKPHGSWCQKLKEPGACFCVPCSRKLLYGSSGKKVLTRHASDPGHIASVRALSHTSTSPGATAAEMPQGSMTRKCVVCHAQIHISCKTCKKCNAEQPRKLRLKRKMEQFDQKRERWVHTHREHGTTSHIRDEAYMLLEKLQALGLRAVLFLSRPKKKPNVWMSEVLTPRCQMSETSSAGLQRMKDLYDDVIQGWTPQGAAGQLDETSPAPVEPSAGPQMVTQDPEVAMALLDSLAASMRLLTALTGVSAAPTGSPTALTGSLKFPMGQPAAVMGPSAHHAVPEQQTLGKTPQYTEGPPAAFPVCLGKDGQREIKTETGNSPTPLSEPATSSQHIKPETEDIRSTSSHTSNLSSSSMMLVTVTDTGFVGNMTDDWEEREEAGRCGEKEKERKRRKMGAEMQRQWFKGFEECKNGNNQHVDMSRSEASDQPFATENIRDVTSPPLQRRIKEENIEATCAGPPTKSPNVQVELKYETTDATISGPEATQVMNLDTRVPQTSRTSDITQSHHMVEAPSAQPSTSCDLDTMDLDQLRREKIKMQIKVLRLQEEYFTHKIKEQRKSNIFIGA